MQLSEKIDSSIAVIERTTKFSGTKAYQKGVLMLIMK
jgi:hypothetical protein